MDYKELCRKLEEDQVSIFTSEELEAFKEMDKLELDIADYEEDFQRLEQMMLDLQDM